MHAANPLYRSIVLVDSLTGHRFDDTKGIRRRKISHHSAMASIVHIGQIDKAIKSPARKKPPHLETEPHKVCIAYDSCRINVFAVLTLLTGH